MTGGSVPYAPAPSTGRLNQGEILGDLVEYLVEPSSLEEGQIKVLPVQHPLCVVLTQDCELEQDHESRDLEASESASDRPDADKIKKAKTLQIPSVLVTPIFPRSGVAAIGVNSKTWKLVIGNSHIRYHFLEAIAPGQDSAALGIEQGVVDFKRYFTMPTELVYAQLKSGVAKRRSRLVSPYLEDLSQRYFSFQSRVALPRAHSAK